MSIKTKLIHQFWSFIDRKKRRFDVQMDLNNACNLNCIHCYHPHHKNINAFSLKDWIDVLNQLKNFFSELNVVPNFSICGGEPLLCPFLYNFIHEIRNRFGGCVIYVLSNGTLIKREDAVRFKNLNVGLQISLDGPDSKRHNSIRGEGSFEKSMLGCAYLKQEGTIFEHQAVLSYRTSHWIEDFFWCARMTGASFMNFTRLIVEGHAKTLKDEGEDYPLERDALKNAMIKILHSSQITNVPTGTSGPLWNLIDDKLGSYCNIGINGFVIGYKGDFKPSSRVSVSLGNVKTEKIRNIYFYNPMMKNLLDGKIAGCSTCRHFYKCRGDRNVSYASFGNFFEKDPGCWLSDTGQLL